MQICCYFLSKWCQHKNVKKFSWVIGRDKLKKGRLGKLIYQILKKVFSQVINMFYLKLKAFN